MKLKLFVTVAALVVIQSGTSQAGLLPVSSDVTQSGGASTYSYAVALTSDATLRTGDYFTIYDFQGLVPGSNTQPAGFTYSSTLVGATPPGTAPQDNPGIANVTWTYTGATTLVGPNSLGNFTVQSQFAASANGQFTSLTHRQSDGQPDSNITVAKVPVPTAPGVPEPTTLVICCASLPFVGLTRFLRAKK